MKKKRERTTGFASLVLLILREDSGRDPRPRGLGRGRWPRGSLATTSTLPFYWRGLGRGWEARTSWVCGVGRERSWSGGPHGGG